MHIAHRALGAAVSFAVVVLAVLVTGLTAVAAHADTRDERTQAWLNDTRAAALAGLPADAPAGSVRVSLKVEESGRLTAPRIVRSSGDKNLDAAALRAAREIRPDQPPIGLAGRRVQLELGAPATVGAR